MKPELCVMLGKKCVFVTGLRLGLCLDKQLLS